MNGSIVRDGRRRITVVVATAALLGAAVGLPAGAAAASPSASSSDSTSGTTDVKAIVRFKADPGKAARAALKANGGSVERTLGLIDGMSVTLPANALAALRRNPLVASVEVDGRIQAFDHAGATGDLEYENAWGVEHVGTYRVHQAGIKGAGIKVAIIDTGLDYVHDVQPNVDPEFLGNYRGGYDFINNDSDPMDDNGHGTHVAGTVAAEKNGYLVVGVAPQVDLYALKVLDATGSGEYSGLIAALDWAVDNGMDVVNMSLGGREVSAALQAAIVAAYDAGITLVAASGNATTFNDLIYGCPVAYPAAYDQVIAVSFTNKSDKLTGFSCTGTQVDLAAPGDQILSTVPVGSCMFCSPNGYSFQSGTSMASPHVAGVAALVLSHGIADGNGNGLLADDVKAHLCSTAGVGASPPITDPKYAKMFGCGIVDADNALINVPPPGGGSGNHPPVAAADAATVSEDSGATVVQVLANDTDPDPGTTLTVTAVSNPPKGTAAVAGGGAWVTYTPDPDTNGTDTFTYTVSDSAGGSATATVTMTVTPGNDSPVAGDDTATVASDGSVTIDVLANDTDGDEDPLQVTAVSDPPDGTATIDAGGTSITYTPDPGAPSSDSFLYTVEDGAGGSDVGLVTITILAPSDPPDAADDAATTDEDTAVVIDVLANDSDPDGDPLTVTDVSTPGFGSATLENDGRITYEPDANANGADTFTYTISDGAFGSDTATVVVDVTPVNDAPTAAAASGTGTAPNAVTVHLAGSDVETCELDFEIVDAPASGTLGAIADLPCDAGTPNDDQADVAYTPNASFIGTDTFTYRTSDGTTSSSARTVTVTINAPANGIHNGNLENKSTKNSTRWSPKVTVTIHKTDHTASTGALITATWSDGASGSSSCIANTNGRCTLATAVVPLTTTSVRFTITSVTLNGQVYLPSMNHDPQGDSDGTTIVITPP